MKIIKKRGALPKWTSEHTETMLLLHKDKKTPEEMVPVLEMSVSTIRKKHHEFGLKTHQPSSWKLGRHDSERSIPKSKPHPLTLAEFTLGAAFDRERMRLDGTPIRFLDLMRETNKRLHARGEEQWTGDESCIVK